MRIITAEWTVDYGLFDSRVLVMIELKCLRCCLFGWVVYVLLHSGCDVALVTLGTICSFQYLKNDCCRSIIAIKIVQQMQPNLFDSTKCHVAKYSCNNYKINPASAIIFPCIDQYHWVHEHKTNSAEPNLKLTIITSQNYIEPHGCFQIFQ